MGPALIQGFREYLLKRCIRLEMTIRNLENQGFDNDDCAAHLESYTGPLRMASLAQLDVCYRKEFNEVEQALGRIEANQYGICLGCGREIDAERLQGCPEREFCEICEAVQQAMRPR